MLEYSNNQFILKCSSKYNNNALYARKRAKLSYSKKMYSRRRYNVLLVEDDEIIRRIYGYFLCDFNCEVEIASTGEEALLKFNDSYDIIFLNIGLPGISGLDVCKSIRSKNLTRQVPIVFITAQGDSFKSDAYSVGGSDFLIKPVDPKDLKLILKKWVI